MITDGRDTPPRSAANYLPALETALAASGGAFASIGGRYYAMDRDNRWPRIEMAWKAMVRGEGRRANNVREAIDNAYKAGEDDEFIVPCVLPEWEPIAADDAVIFINFRKDRPRQMVQALFKEDFEGFDRGDFRPASVTCMAEYDEWFGLPYAFDHEQPPTTLAHILSDAGLRQFHCAETEKYAHVTFFFNGGRNDPFPGEDRELIPSPQVPTYDLKPEMSASEVADAVIAALQTNKYAFLVVNFANGDMVGHTAVREAVIQAVETLDREVGRVLDSAVAQGYSVLLTSDHGNCDEMLDPITGAPHTQHTVYPVPCLIIDDIPWRLATGGGLANVAPTVLQLLGMARPDAMQGESLLLAPARVE